MNEINPHTSARQSGVSNRRFTPEEKLELWKRRERAAELHAKGRTYAEIAAELDCGVTTAFKYVQHYFENAAKYYRAPVFREVLARSYRATIRRCQEQIDLIGADKEQTAAVMQTIDRIHDALAGLAKVYGFQGTNAFDLELPISPAEAAGPHDSPWAKDIPPERLREIRARALSLYRLLPGSAVPASFAEEVASAEVVDEVPPDPPKTEGEVQE